jgi:hypothetical protein
VRFFLSVPSTFMTEISALLSCSSPPSKSPNRWLEKAIFWASGDQSNSSILRVFVRRVAASSVRGSASLM